MDRRNDLTRQAILDAAVDLLETEGMVELTMRAVARCAGMSERTLFRYFATRDELFDAIAVAAHERMQVPPPPTTVAELESHPALLYRTFESRKKLVIAGLHSTLSDRIRANAARTRWAAIERLVEDFARARPPRARKLATAQVNYYLGASTWNFYRHHFGFSLADSVAAAEQAIRLALDSLR
jgi:AcrR family transcriptional regulator